MPTVEVGRWSVAGSRTRGQVGWRLVIGAEAVHAWMLEVGYGMEFNFKHEIRTFGWEHL